MNGITIHDLQATVMPADLSNSFIHLTLFDSAGYKDYRLSLSEFVKAFSANNTVTVDIAKQVSEAVDKAKETITLDLNSKVKEINDTIDQHVAEKLKTLPLKAGVGLKDDNGSMSLNTGTLDDILLGGVGSEGKVVTAKLLHDFLLASGFSVDSAGKLILNGGNTVTPTAPTPVSVTELSVPVVGLLDAGLTNEVSGRQAFLFNREQANQLATAGSSVCNENGPYVLIQDDKFQFAVGVLDKPLLSSSHQPTTLSPQLINLVTTGNTVTLGALSDSQPASELTLLFSVSKRGNSKLVADASEVLDTYDFSVNLKPKDGNATGWTYTLTKAVGATGLSLMCTKSTGTTVVATNVTDKVSGKAQPLQGTVTLAPTATEAARDFTGLTATPVGTTTATQLSGELLLTYSVTVKATGKKVEYVVPLSIVVAK